MDTFKKALMVVGLAVIFIWGLYNWGGWRIEMNQDRVLSDERNYVEPVETEPASLGTNPAGLAWKEATAHADWSPRDSQGGIVFNDKMWIFGGLRGFSEAENNYGVAPHFNDIWSSEDGINWTLEREHAEWSPRRSISIEYFKGKLWMFGGWSTTTGYRTGIWVSDDAIHWREVLRDVPWGAREGQTSAVFQGKLWMIGGLSYGAKLGEQNLKNDVWNSEDGIHWNLATSDGGWAGRYDHGTTVFNGKLWVAGGLSHGKAMNDVWSSADGKVWVLENGNAPWEERHGMPLVNYDNRLWLVSGWGTINEKGTQDVWYSANGKDWLKAGNDFAWPGREDHEVMVFKDKLWVMAGMGPFWRWNNDVWYSDFGK
ncbi:MAG: hypothetical protein M1471_00295 [Patescibacteria group bacterium]|nr:hypothetical protein [Patescibacteria group bacterium]